MAQSLVFCVIVRILKWGSCVSIFCFLRHGWETFSGVRVAQILVFCVMVGKHSVAWGSCGSIFSFLRHGWETFSGVRVAHSLLYCLMVGRLEWGSCGSIFRFLCDDW